MGTALLAPRYNISGRSRGFVTPKGTKKAPCCRFFRQQGENMLKNYAVVALHSLGFIIFIFDERQRIVTFSFPFQQSLPGQLLQDPLGLTQAVV